MNDNGDNGDGDGDGARGGSDRPFSATIRKSGNELVRVTVDEYRGREVLEIRIWVVDAESGEVHPTRKGVTVSTARLPELVSILQQALLAVNPTSRSGA